MNKFNVGIYLRLSREDGNDGESGSIKNQRALLMNYIQEHHLNFSSEYVDDGVSGTTFQREGFLQLIDDIKAKKINMVLTKDTSRLGRDHIEFGYYVEKFFPEHHVRYVAVNDNIDTFSNQNDMLLFKSAYNDMYVRDISNKIRSSLSIKKKNGEFVGAFAPYGYKKDIYDKHKLVVDEKAALVVKRIFHLFIEGKSISAIGETLTRENVLIPSIHQGMNRGLKSTMFGVWNSRTISDILTNPTYIGNLAQGKSKKVSYKSNKRIHTRKEDWIVKENSCPMIISKDDFFLANEIYKANRYERKNSLDDEILLKGLVYCRECGHRIGFRKVGSYVYGECNYYLKYKKYQACTSHSIRYDIFEDYVLSDLRKKLGKDQLYSILIGIYEKNISFLLNKIKREKLSLEKERALFSKKMDLVYEDRLNGVIDENQYFRTVERLKIEKESNDKKIKKYEEKVDNLLKNLDQDKIKQLASNYKIDKLFVSRLIKKITFSQDGKIDVYYQVKNCDF